MTTDTPPAEPGEKASFIEGALNAIKGKGLKYSMVSIVNVVTGQALIKAFQVAGLEDAKANALAVLISAVPAYYMSRAWVWGKRGKSEFKREVIPFWIFVAIGLFLSTFFVAAIGTVWTNISGNEMPHFMTNLINLGSFGILWVIRFFWMDKAFHLDTHHEHGPLDVLLDEDEPV